MLKRTYSDKHVAKSDCQIRQEQQKIAVVLETNTVINPWTMMVHKKDTRITDFTVMSTSRFYLLANVALFRPELLQVLNSFASIT